MSPGDACWQFWIDRGGTFTDIVARRPDGRLLTHKLLSENPERYRDAALQGIADILDVHARDSAAVIQAVRMGTTVGTNALLERQGAATVLAINDGFGDALAIGYQSRPDIFALRIQRPAPLYGHVLEIRGRLDAAGREVEPLDLALAEAGLRAAFAQGYRSLAIVLLHAWRNPAHELALEDLARRLGYDQVSVSHRCSPAIRLVGRGDTTVVDAYLSPILRRYVAQVANGLAGLRQATIRGKPARLRFMQSNGGLAEAGHFQGKDSILSGPAGGIIGAVVAARRAGFDRIVTFDMGGTSTDVAHWAGELERAEETRVAGIRLRVPMLNIHAVAAGGGSVLHYDGLRFRAGPDSAGASPGPACYRRGGPLTVTDANVMLGKLRPEFFPRLFGPDGRQPLDVESVRAGFETLAAAVSRDTGRAVLPEAVAEGFLAVAVEHMAAAIKRISVQRGHDLGRDYTLCGFGAAAGQHACRVAERLGLRRILLHPLAGVLSAYGMGLADHRVLRERAIVRTLEPQLEPRLAAELATLEAACLDELASQGLADAGLACLKQASLRYAGSDTALEVPFASAIAMREAFEARHQQRFGFIAPDKPLVVDRLGVEVVASEPVTAAFEMPATDRGAGGLVAQVRLFSGDRFHEAPVYQRSGLAVGQRLEGPAIVLEPTATTIVEPGWVGEITPLGDLVLTSRYPGNVAAYGDTTPDPARLEIFNRLFMSLAEEMGYALQNTAHSVNIKERLDFSCAIFNERGELIANAPHIPVHLGSMGASVEALIHSRRESLRPGDAWLVNSPYHGGTHLPDITVITPVFDESSERILFYLAARGHHADVGGITPGSMPPGSCRIGDEGVLSEGLRIVADGRFLEPEVRAWLAGGPCPARNPEQNLADRRAQVAANTRGANGLRRLVAAYSLATVRAYMNHVLDHAEESVRRAITRLRDGRCEVRTDAGAAIRVEIRVDPRNRSALIDFTGTSPQQADNVNAPAAVTRAAVLYVFRTLVADDIPLNAGCLRPLAIRLPDGSMLNPRPPAAVVAGNVETSQQVVDALYGALGVMAAAQGTMNNLTFGNADYQYYETIGGGSGAGADFDGADAVQTHMTNSRITDPEILEWRFPVRVVRFAIRRGSGGPGRHRGGDGIVREFLFLAPMTAGILSSRRQTAPFGLEGGLPGQPGVNVMIRADQTRQILGPRAEVFVAVGDRLSIETPGGGGFGSPPATGT